MGPVEGVRRVEEMLEMIPKLMSEAHDAIT